MTAKRIDAFALKNGIPPSAAHRVCIDLDKTIIPWGGLETVRPPFAGVARAIRRLREAGYQVVILTSRLSPTWWKDEARRRHVNYFRFSEAQHDMVVRLLAEGGIEFDLATSEKLPAEAYFDDKAIRVEPEDWSLYAAVADFLEGVTA